MASSFFTTESAGKLTIAERPLLKPLELPQIWFRLTKDVPQHLGDPVGTHREKETISVQTRRV